MPLRKPPVIIENRSTWHESNINFTYQLCSDLSVSYHGIYILHHGIEFKNNFNSMVKWSKTNCTAVSVNNLISWKFFNS